MFQNVLSLKVKEIVTDFKDSKGTTNFVYFQADIPISRSLYFKVHSKASLPKYD